MRHPPVPWSPWDLDKECLGDQRADRVVSVSRIAEKLMCMVSKPTAPRGRADGGRGVIKEGSKEVVTHPEAGTLGAMPCGPEGFVLSLGLRAATLYIWALGCEALLARGWAGLVLPLGESSRHRLLGWGWVEETVHGAVLVQDRRPTFIERFLCARHCIIHPRQLGDNLCLSHPS